MGCYFLLQGIFLTQGLNSCLLHILHCRKILYRLSYQGSPLKMLKLFDYAAAAQSLTYFRLRLHLIVFCLMLKCTDFSWIRCEEDGGWLWGMASDVQTDMNACACTHTHTPHTHTLSREWIPFLNLVKPGKHTKGDLLSFTYSVWHITNASVSLNKTTGLIRIHTYFQHITFCTVIKFLYNMDFLVKWV